MGTTIKTKFANGDKVYLKNGGKISGPHTIHHTNVRIGYYVDNITYALRGGYSPSTYNEILLLTSDEAKEFLKLNK